MYGYESYFVEELLAGLIKEWNDNRAKAAQKAPVLDESTSGTVPARPLAQDGVESFWTTTLFALNDFNQIALFGLDNYLDLPARTLGGFATAYFAMFFALPVIMAILLHRHLDGITDYTVKVSVSYLLPLLSRWLVGLYSATILQGLIMVTMLVRSGLPIVGHENHARVAQPDSRIEASMMKLLVESHSWPLFFVWWIILNILLIEDRDLSLHCLYLHDAIPLFNDSWPSSNLVESELFTKVVYFALIFSVVVSFKLLAVQLDREKQAFLCDAQKIMEVMRNLLVILEIADFNKITDNDEILTEHYKNGFKKLLEDVEKSTPSCLQDDHVSMYGLHLFRTVLALLQKELPLRLPEDIYEGLLTLQGETTTKINFLNIFESIPSFKTKALALIKLFRPDLNGEISKEDFVWSIYAAYEEYRLLQVTSVSASRDDHAFEQTANIIFYVAVTYAIAFLLGVDHKVLYYSFLLCIIVSSVIVKMKTGVDFFEELLFRIKGRSYGVGDVIAVDPSRTFASTSPIFKKENTWRVKKIYLLTTDLVNVSNGSRSNKANGYFSNWDTMTNWSQYPASFPIILQVPVGTRDCDGPFKEFHEMIEQYANDNPREFQPMCRSFEEVVRENKYTEYSIRIR